MDVPQDVADVVDVCGIYGCTGVMKPAGQPTRDEFGCGNVAIMCDADPAHTGTWQWAIRETTQR